MTSNHPELTAALEQMALAEPAYAQAESMYDGEVDEVLGSKKLRELFGDQGKKFRVNYARTPVDVLVERTKIQGWTCEDSQQLAAIEQVWTDNELGIEAKDVSLKAYEYGDSYLIAWPEEDDPDFPGGVSVYQHGPKHVRVFYDEEKPRKKRCAAHRWQVVGTGDNGLGKGTWQRVNLYYPDRIEQWVSKEPVLDAMGRAIQLRADAEYEPYDVEGQWPLPNPYGIVPVFHFRTGRPYGRPEHQDAYGPQYGINKLLLSLMGAVDHAVLPQRYALTDSALEQNRPADAFEEAVGPDELTTESTTDGLDNGSSMESGPGNVWLLSGNNVRVGQFSAADSKNFIDPMEALVQQMADVTDLPANRYHRGGQQPSGDSQRMSEVPLNNKAEDRHDQFGVTWHEFAQFICDVHGLGETDAQVAWEPPEHYSDKASWESAKLQLEAGIPFDQVMRERGYSSDVIKDWRGQRVPEPVAAPAPVPVEDGSVPLLPGTLPNVP